MSSEVWAYMNPETSIFQHYCLRGQGIAEDYFERNGANFNSPFDRDTTTV